MAHQSNRRMRGSLVLAALSLMLTSCFITPGKFASELVVKNSGEFAFSYDGEIFFMGLSKLAQMGAANETFEAQTCYDDEFEERECSEDEIAEQRADWDAGADARAAKAKKDAEEMAAIMGGIDPTDPDAAEELRALLQRHKGWNKVEHKGEGVYEVEYAISGTLTHDLIFPTIEGFPTTNPFVQVILRDGGQVRVNATGFAMQEGGGPMTQMMGGMAGLMAMGQDEKAGEEMPDVPALEGTFTIRTDGRILANNTDEGPQSDAIGEALSWDVSARTTAAPTALIAIGE